MPFNAKNNRLSKDTNHKITSGLGLCIHASITCALQT